MFPPHQFTVHGLSSPGAPRVPPAPPGNNPVIWPTASTSSVPGWHPGAPGWLPISLPTKQFQLAADPRRTDVAGISDWPPMPEICQDEYNAEYKSDDLSDLGGAKGKSGISLKQIEFCLKQSAKMMGQPNFSTFNKWKEIWLAGYLDKKHWSIIRGKNHLKRLWDALLHWETAVADFLGTFKTWLPLEHFDNAEWIRREWVQMLLKICATEVQEARKKGRRGNKWPVMYLGEFLGNKARGNLPELPNTTFMVLICWVPIGNNDQALRTHLQASYTDVRHWEELVDFIEQHCGLKEPYYLTGIYKCNLMQEELKEEYIELYALGQMMNDLLYGQISYNSSLSNAFKLKLGHNLKLFFVEMKAATGKDIAEHIIRPVKVIPTKLVQVSYAPLLIRILRLRRELMKMNEWWMRRQLRKRLIVVWMQVLIK